MSLVKFSDIPGLREAIKRENDIRDAAFLDLTTNICGIEIRQMTPRDLLILDGIGNPIVSNRFPSAEELTDFLWKLSREYREFSPVRRWIFASRCRRINLLEAAEKCRKYIADTFQDSPPGDAPQSTPYTSWCAHMVISVAGETGWSEPEIINMPLKRLFQYLKVIQRRRDPIAPMYNPSDKVKGDHLRLQNARNQLLKLLKRRANN